MYQKVKIVEVNCCDKVLVVLPYIFFSSESYFQNTRDNSLIIPYFTILFNQTL